jgi:signal transduction histidine kinase/CheY-like chemotaxis protein
VPKKDSLNSYRRYRGLILLVTIFFALEGAVLFASIALSSQLESLATSVNIAGRQRMLSQRIAKDIYQLEHQVREGADISIQRDELRTAVDLFGSTLRAFREGGEVMAPDGANRVWVGALSSEEFDRLAGDSMTLWTQVEPELQSIHQRLNDAPSVLAQLQALGNDFAVVEAVLLREMNALTGHLELKATNYASLSRGIQSAGILIALIMMVIISFYSLKRFRRTDESLADADEALREKIVLLDAAKKRAEAANEAKAQFLANMTHELRTPLNGVSGLAQVLLRSELSNEQCKQVNTILKTSNKLAEIINEIIDFSSLEAGSAVLQQVHFSPKSLLDSIIEHHVDDAQKNGNTITVQLDEHLPNHVIGDRSRLRQVLTSLLDNACKFCKEGEITLSIRCVSRRDNLIDVLFCVEDTGCGIGAKQLTNIFDVFTQAENHSSRSYQGTGLGLAHTQKLVELLGGTIEVDSKLNQGTRFFVQVPLQMHQTEQDSEAYKLVRKIRPLILETSDERSKMLAERLSLWDVGHIYAKDVDELFACLTNRAELKMTCVVGDFSQLSHEVMRRLAHEVDDLPIIELSSYEFDTSMGDAGTIETHGKIDMGIGGLELAETLVTAHYGDVRDELEVDRLKANFEGVQVLLVDDNEVNRMVAELLLSEVNLSVECATNGAEAVELVRNHGYMAVLMDCQMPVMDGYEATRRIRALNNPMKSSIPIIAMTANAQAGDREKCLDAGMNDYLTKPIDAEELYITLAQWIAAREQELLNRKD